MPPVEHLLSMVVLGEMERLPTEKPKVRGTVDNRDLNDLRSLGKEEERQVANIPEFKVYSQ